MKSQRFHIGHSFGLDKKLPAENKTLIVIIITTIAMIGEILGGLLTGSMALLADGLHMAAHALAIGISYFAYRFIRKHANNTKFSFGTGKVNAVAGYTGAMLLLLFALLMGYESVDRIIHPQDISFNAAITVAVIGLVVNLTCAVILGHGSGHDHGHDHGHSHSHGDHSHAHSHKHDTNYKAVYLHILTDALTSVLAIVSLVIAKYFGTIWLDPIMGIVGAILIIVWSRGLFAETLKTLLDHQNMEMDKRIREKLKDLEEVELRDLHIWAIGPNIFAGELTIESKAHVSVMEIKEKLQSMKELVHLTVEVHCDHCGVH